MDKLEENQLVRRDRSKTDHRTVHIHLTEKGRRILINHAPKRTQGKLTSALEQLSAKQLTMLENGLDDLIEALQVKGEDDHTD